MSFNTARFQDKKDYNFSNKPITTGVLPVGGNIYSMLLLNKVILTQKLNTINLANNGYFLAKSTNIQKKCEVNPERLPVFAKRTNTKNTGKAQYTKVGYNKHSLYSIFRAIRRDKLFLNEKFYQNLMGKRAFMFYNSGLKHYNKQVGELKKFNKYLEQQIWNTADRRNQYFLNVFDISAYTYHSYVDVTKEKNENKKVKSARLFLDIWDSVDDYASYWYADYWYDANFPTNKPKENESILANSLQNLRDYETYYGMFYFREKMKKHLWRLRLGRTMYLNIFSKNATRVNFLNVAETEYTTNNSYISTRRGSNSLLRFLYTKHIFPRNRVEGWKGYDKHNVFLNGLQGSVSSVVDTEGLPPEDFKFNFIRKLNRKQHSNNSNIVTSTKNLKSPITGGKSLKKGLIVRTQLSSSLFRKKIETAILKASARVGSGLVRSNLNKLNAVRFRAVSNTVDKINKIRSKFLRGTKRCTVFINTRFKLNQYKLKTLVLNVIFNNRRLLEYTNWEAMRNNANYFEDSARAFKHIVKKTTLTGYDVDSSEISAYEKIHAVRKNTAPIAYLPSYIGHGRTSNFAVNFLKRDRSFVAVSLGGETNVHFDTGIVTLKHWVNSTKRKAKKARGAKRRRVLKVRAKIWVESIHALKVSSNLAKLAILPLVFKKKLKVNTDVFNGFNTKISNFKDLKSVYNGLSENVSRNIHLNYLSTGARNVDKYNNTLKTFLKNKSLWARSTYRENGLKQPKHVDTRPLRSKFIMSMAVKSKVNFKLREAKVTGLREFILWHLAEAGVSVSTPNRFIVSRNKIGSSILVPHRGTTGKKPFKLKIFKPRNNNVANLFLVSATKLVTKNSVHFLSNLAGQRFKLKTGLNLKNSSRGINVHTRLASLPKILANVGIQTRWASHLRAHRKKLQRAQLFAVVEDYLGITRINNRLALSNMVVCAVEGITEGLKKSEGIAIPADELEIHKPSKVWKPVVDLKSFEFYDDYIANYIDSWKSVAFALGVDTPLALKSYYSEIFNTKIASGEYDRLGIIEGPKAPVEARVVQNLPGNLCRLNFLHQPKVKNISYVNKVVDYALERLQSKLVDGEILDDETLPAISMRSSELAGIEHFTLEGNSAHRLRRKVEGTISQFNNTRMFNSWENDGGFLTQFFSKVELAFAHGLMVEDGPLSFRRRAVFGNAAKTKQMSNGWSRFIHKHQFLRDVHTQVGMRRFPETWYKPGRRKYPLKSQKKDWGLKIPLASRANPNKGRLFVTTADSSVVYYKHIGWSSWTRFFKKLHKLDHIYRYGREEEPVADMPLTTTMNRTRQQTQAAIYEEYLAEFSFLGHNWFDFIPMSDNDTVTEERSLGKTILRYEYQEGEEVLRGMDRYFRPYRDAVSGWFKRLKPMFSYSGIKTYYQYNSYIMQLNNDMKSRRYKALFNNFAFAFKLNKTDFAKNITYINFFKLHADTNKLSTAHVATYIYKHRYNFFKKDFNYRSMSIKAGKYKFRTCHTDSALLSDSEAVVNTLRMTGGDYYQDIIGNKRLARYEARNRSDYVLTEHQFKFINRVHRSTLKTHGRFKTLDLRHGLSTFVTKNALWW